MEGLSEDSRSYEHRTSRIRSTALHTYCACLLVTLEANGRNAEPAGAAFFTSPARRGSPRGRATELETDSCFARFVNRGGGRLYCLYVTTQHIRQSGLV
jgi:hypothetical protein